MTYFFNIKDYGLQPHLFKICNIDLTQEIRKIKENPEKVKSIDGFPIDYESYIIVISYAKHKELYFFKSISYGLKKYTELRKAIGLRIWAAALSNPGEYDITHHTLKKKKKKKNRYIIILIHNIV